MNSHIPFQKLSEYLENDLDGAERGEVERHLSACDFCGKELSCLKKIIDGSSAIRAGIKMNSELFVLSTMKRIRRRRPIQLIKKYMMPVSAAAILLIVVGAGFIDAHIIDKRNTVSQTAKTSVSAIDSEDFIGVAISVDQIRAILDKHGARITKSSDEYVDAEVKLADYQKIRGDLGFAEFPGFAGGGAILSGAGDDAPGVSQGRHDAEMVRIRIRRK
jgi:hypothetical protein